jgi:protein-tyrosine phosphatase
VRLDWPDCVNARDLGGLPTYDGRRTRVGALIRSDNHDRLTQVGIAAVRAVGPSRIIDVRAVWEAEKYRSPFAGSPEYVNMPLSVDVDQDPETLLDDYLLIVDAGREAVAAAVVALAEAPPGPVIVHCHAGKDRAGLLIAFALTIAGVGAATVVADYARSDGADPQVMFSVLQHLDERFGGMRRYLLDAGVQPHHLEAIHDRCRVTDPAN